MQPQKAKGAQLLGKALSIINIVADNPGRVRFDDIHAETGYSRPTLYRILGVLIQNGILRQDKRDQAYQIGLRFTELAFSKNIEADLSVIAGHELLKIFRLTGEAVSLGIFTEGHMTLVQRFEPSVTRAWTHANPTRRPLHCTALGKAYLSALPQNERSALLSRTTFVAYTPTTLTDAAALEREIVRIRECGWSYENEEFIVGNGCVGVPLQTKNGDVLGAISVSAPVFRFDETRRREIAALLKEAATAISRSLPERSSDSLPLAGNTKLLGARHFFQPSALSLDGERVLIADAMGPSVSAFSGGQFSEVCTAAQPITAMGWRGATLVIATGKRLYPCREQIGATPLFDLPSPVKSLSSDARHRLWGSRNGKKGDHLFLTTPSQKPVEIALSEEIRIDALHADERVLFLLDNEQRVLWRASPETATAKGKALMLTRFHDLKTFPGTPKSVAVTVDGSLWVCGLGAEVLWRISPDGQRMTTVPLPVPTATACLGHPSGRTLLVATGRLGVSVEKLRDNPYSGCLLSVEI